ncbi:uncharacterized protein LOC110987908 [Acanthaster planci]|uniref:Nucleoporin NUP42 n=1 Tax=Acanthaster planci TaxID=133434 RepID=A0A8B7ZMV1_ACAPL|nr:uncharacterized protein LOC110987908 [Acanthaster planci]
MSDVESQSDSNHAPELQQATISCSTEDSQQSTDSRLAKQDGDTVAAEPNKEIKAASAGKKVPQCRFFKTTGKCRYGDGCKYAHEIASTAQGEEGSAAETGAGGDHQQDPLPKASREKLPAAEEAEQKICRFFARSGWCRNGKRCRFLHERVKAELSSNRDEVDTSKGASEENPEDVTQDGTSNRKPEGETKKKEKPKKVCRYFKAGHCSTGDRCKFLHPEVEGSLGSDASTQCEPVKSRPAMPRPDPIRDKAVSMKIADLGKEDMLQLREMEIAQLIKRFPADRMTQVETEGADSVFRVTVSPTDPDWPFDITDFEFELMFSASYPADPFVVSMPEDQVLPNAVLTHMKESIEEWILARHGTNQIAGKVELMFRPFLRWLDRSLERLFTEAAKQFKKVVDAKAAGIEFVPYAKQKPPEPRDITQYCDVNHPVEAEGVIVTKGKTSDHNRETAGDAPSADTVNRLTRPEETSRANDGKLDTDATSEDKLNRYADLFNVQRRGTEIKFSQIELSESVSTLVATLIGVTIQCARCKNHCDIVTPPKRVNMARCGKCQHQQLLTYRQSLIHHFTATLGFLDLEGCSTFDLILSQCEFLLGCLHCSEETKVQGMQFGQTRTTWCEKCHTKMTVFLETARFHQLQVQAMETQAGQKAHVIQVKQLRNQVHPDIHEGQPLPDNGTCKHYRKSFRWFRFPCCGKCYPCDECHDDNEPDHEMKYATRIICGFCCKEQQHIPDKPCISCQSLTTKGRTSHWEGGTGCRNKIKMNRNDKQKFSNLNKTTSRKQQRLQGDKKAL